MCVHSSGFAGFCWVSEAFLRLWTRIAEFLRRWPLAAWTLGFAAAALAFLPVVVYLRDANVTGGYQTYLYLEVGGTLLSFCYAANALVRFRGTHDRIALILSFGFVLSGLIETVGYFHFGQYLHPGSNAYLHLPLGWMVSRTLLAVLLLAALAVETYTPTARQPSKEIAISLLVVALCAYGTSAAFLAAPSAPSSHPPRLLSRSWDLLPAALFFAAALAFLWRLGGEPNA